MKSIKELSLQSKTKAFFKNGIKQNFINNTWVSAKSEKKIDIINPANEEVIARIPISSSEDINNAVIAAKEAFQNKEWRKMMPSDRERLLHKLACYLEFTIW